MESDEISGAYAETFNVTTYSTTNPG
jgi:hypothetical protein